MQPQALAPATPCNRPCSIPAALLRQDSRNVTMVVINVRITRFWRYAVLNCVLPVRKEAAGRNAAPGAQAKRWALPWFSLLPGSAPLRHQPLPAACPSYVQVLLVGGISFVVFWIDRKEMATRLGGHPHKRRAARLHTLKEEVQRSVDTRTPCAPSVGRQ
jgi:hypothetical protein